MRTLGLVVTLGLALLAAPFAAEAQQGGKVPRIGFLVWQAGPPPGPWRDAFLQGLRDVGYVVGQNIAVERRYGKEDQLLTLAAELVRLKVDVIVTTGTPAALAAKEATQTIPIVALWMGDPVASGLVTSLGRPGGNVTGMSLFGPEVFTKGLQLLKEAIPRISRVGVLRDPTNAAQVAIMNVGQAPADVLGVKLQPIDLRTGVDLESAFSTARRSRAEALYVLPVLVDPEQLAKLAMKSPVADDGLPEGVCRPGQPDVLRTESSGSASPRRGLRRQDPQGG